MSDEQVPAGSPWAEIRSGGALPQFLLLCLGIWLHAADAALMATLLPSAVSELGEVELMGWTFALYQMGSIVGVATTALATAALGLGRAMALGALLFAAGCMAGALAPAMAVVVAGRLLQGLGGGALVAITLVAANRIFAPRLIPHVMALISMNWVTAALLGPLIGGLFANAGYWRFGYWAFALQALLLALGALALLRRPERPAESYEVGVPWRGLALLCTAILAISVAGSALDVVRTPFLLAFGLLVLAVFLRLDHRAGARALLPADAVRLGSAVNGGLVFVFCFASATIPFVLYGPLLMSLLYETRPLTAGYAIALMSVGWTGAALLFAGTGRRGEPALIAGGAVLVTLGLAGFALVMPRGPFPALLPFALAQGAGFGICWAFILRRVTAAAPVEQKDRAAASMAFAYQLGYAAGSAFAGLVANLAGFGAGATPAAAAAVGFWVFIAFLPLCLVGAVAAWRLARDEG
jgi:MFS family permease